VKLRFQPDRPVAVLPGIRLLLTTAAVSILAAGALVAFAVQIARRLEPPPYLLTHFLSLGSAAIALGALRALGPLLDRVPFPAATLAARVSALGLIGYSFYVEPHWIESPEVRVRIPALPAGFEGMRIALVADVHVGPHLGSKEVDQLIGVVEAARPDAVVLLGDYVARDPFDTAVFASGLSRLQPARGIYAVLGNHDHWQDPELVSSILSSGGAKVLRNRGVALESSDGRLWIAGVDDIRLGRPSIPLALAGARESDSKILLVHNPMLVRSAEASAFDLILAGHTHGGQVQLPLVGPLILPISDRSLTQGLIKRDASQLYVTRGVGVGTPPVRFGARPEIPIIVLSRAD
jgi:predicted MPP superfamily phosphohydrolase